MQRNRARLLAWLFTAAALSPAASAQTFTYSVYVDQDNSTASGCTVTLPSGTFAGADIRIDATATGGAAPAVNSVTRASCTGAAFGAGSAFGASAAFGANTGTSGADVIELGMAEIAVVPPGLTARLGFTATSATGSDSVFTTTGIAGGGPILLGGTPVSVPGLSLFAMLLLASVVVFVGARAARRARRWIALTLFALAGVAIAANFVVDGQVNDWVGEPISATDPANDPTTNEAGIDLLAIYADRENGSVFFRLDVRDLQNQAPTANPQAVTVAEEGSVTITLTGSDPEGAPLTFAIATNPTLGTLSAITPINATSASVTYTGALNQNGADSFTFTASDGTTTSVPGTVSITITPVNDAPVVNPQTFTVVENSPNATVVGTATATDVDTGQTLTWLIQSGNTGGAFAIDANTGQITVANSAAIDPGTPTFTLVVQATDNGVPPASGTGNVTINVTGINDEPSFTAGPNQTVNEDALAQSLAWATAISAGPPDEAGQTLTFTLGNDNNALFAVQPAVSAAGVLSYTLAANANGVANITIFLSDNGGTAGGGDDTSPTQNFTITVTAVNDPPSFTAGPNQTVFQGTPATTVDPWATGISPGPTADEAGQTITFAATNDNNALFSVQPAVSPTGALSFTPAAGQVGIANVTVTATDTGGTANGGVDTSAPQVFTITVTDVNDAPSFTAGPNQTSAEDAGPQTGTPDPWATNIQDNDPGNQAFTFLIEVDNNALFTTPPAISPTGTLTWTSAPNANGVANVTVQLMDDGGTANGGIDTSADQTFTITVTPVNDAPVLTPSGTPANFTEGGAAVFADPAMGVADIDSASLTGATISITGNFQSGQDVLSFTNTPNITGTYVAGTGVLTLTGTDTLANYQLALREVSYSNSSNAPDTGARTLSWSATDGALTSTVVTSSVTITAVNTPPVLTAGGVTNTFTEDGPAAIVDGGITASDVDNTTLQAATVILTARPDGDAQESLAANTGGTAITATYTAATGTLALSGADTLANYQTVLRSIAYSNASNTPTTSARSVSFTVNDGTANSNTTNASVNVAANNDAPTITAGGTGNFTEGGGAVQIDNTVTPADVDSANLASATVSITANLQAGQDSLACPSCGGLGITAVFASPTLTLTGSATVADYQTALRSVTFDNSSNAPSTAARTISWAVNDGALASTPATSTVTVNAVNTAPVLTPGGVTNTFTEDGPAAIVDGGITPSDVDNTTLQSGSVVLTARPDGDAQESLTANTGGTAITAVYTAATGTLALTGTDTLANYQAVLRSVAYSNSSNTPTTTARTVTFTVSDGAALSNTTNASVNVAATNDAPTITAGATATFTEGAGAVQIDNTVTPADVDSANLASATVSITANLQAGQDTLACPSCGGLGITAVFASPTLTLTGSTTVANYQTALRSVTFDNGSNAPSTAARTISWTVNDGALPSNTATSTVNVVAVNSPPVVTTSAGNTTYVENAAAIAVDAALTAVDVDSTNASGAIVSITGNFQSGEDVLAFATIGPISGTYVPATGVLTLTGTDTVANYQAALRTVTYANTSDTPIVTDRVVSFVLTDDSATSSAPATKTVAVQAANDAPVVTLSGTVATFNEDGVAVGVDPALTVTDPDDVNLESATVSILAPPDGASETLAATACGALVVAGTNPLTITGSQPLATYQTCLQSVVYANSSQNPSVAARTIRFLANDGDVNSANADKTLNVTASNDAPVNTAPAAAVTDEDMALVFTAASVISVADVDAGTGNITVTLTATNGTIDADNTGGATIGGDNTAVATITGTLAQVNATLDGTRYVPTLNYFGPATVQVGTNDNGNTGAPGPLTDTDTINITVNPINDPPVADDETFSGVDSAIGNTAHVVNDPDDGAPDPTGPQKTITGDILDGDTDIDSVGLTVTPGTFATNDGGQVVVEADGDFTFHPAAGASCTDTSDFFDYTVEDNDPLGELTDVGRVTITITDCVWYVDGAAPAAGDGRSHLPFQTLAGVNSVGDPDQPGQRIFVYEGNYTGGLTLENTQTLSGERHGLTVGALVLEPAGGANTDIAGGLTLANGNTVQGIHLGNSATFALSGNAVGTTVINTVTTGAINNTTGGAVNITGGGALNVAFTTISSNGGTNGINLVGVSGTFTGSGGALSNATGATVNLSGGSSNFTYDGTITDDQGALVTIANETAGTKDFNGNITDGNDGDGNGISLTTNTGAVIRFDGGMTLSTGANAAFNATGGGTLHITDPAGTVDNVLTTTTGVALNVANTNIGNSDLTFRSITAGTVASGPINGISLNTTGAAGGLNVQGNGAAGSGGVIQRASQRGARFVNANQIDLRSMTFTNNGTVNLDAAATCGDAALGNNTNCAAGIDLQSVDSFALANTIISGGVQIGLNGRDVQDLSLNTVTVQNVGDESLEDGVQLTDVAGTATVTNSNFTGNFHRQFELQNATGTLTKTITGSTFDAGAYLSTKAQGLLVAGGGNAVITSTVEDSNFNNNFGAGLFVQSLGNGNVNVTVGHASNAALGNTFSNNSGAMQILADQNSTLTYLVANNTHTVSGGVVTSGFTPFTFRKAFPATGLVVGTVRDNTIGTSGVAQSGNNCAGCNAITITNEGASGGMRVTVSNNIVQRINQRGMEVIVQGDDTVGVVVTGNTFREPEGTVGQAIFAQSNNDPTDNGSLCMDITGNTIGGLWDTGVIPGGRNIRLRQAPAGGAAPAPATGAPFRLRNVGGTGSVADVTTYLNANNTNALSGNSALSSFTTGGAPCF